MARTLPRILSAVLVVSASVITAAVTTTLTARPVFTASTTQTLVRPTPNVLRSVQELARLETVTFHMERVIDLREEQTHLFGLVQADDSILLVAVGEVVAGVDLGGLRPEDVRVDAATRRVTLTLPRPQVFSTRLDGQNTHVHRRDTDLLAERQEELETRARNEAERSITQGALEAGVLDRARHGAEQTVGGLVRALGFTDVVIRWR